MHVDDVLRALMKQGEDIENFNADLLETLERAKGIGRLFIMGNGGSSAIASHAVCDLMKRAATLPVICLSDNAPIVTAIANDMSYDHVFSEQLKYHHLAEDDVVLVISSSGNSPNVIRALDVAENVGAHRYAMVGFTGGKCKRPGVNLLHIKSDVYEVVEDCHSIALHDLVREIMKREQEKSW